MHQGFVARACTASVCASQQVCVQVQAQHGIASSFSLLSLRESLWNTCNTSHRIQGMCVCVALLIPQTPLIVGILLYK